jgi:hypothetical protein
MKKNNWKNKAVVIIVILCLISSFVLNKTKENNDYNINEIKDISISNFLSQIGEYGSTSPWNRSYGGSSYDAFWTINVTSEGGYILGGQTSSYGAGGVDCWLIKTDSQGNEIWNKTYGGNYDDSLWYIEQTSDGGYIIVGDTKSFGAGVSDVFLIKTDSNGNESWNKTYGGINADCGNCVRQISEGYIIIGWTYSYGNGDCDVWLIKTDQTGDEIWNQTFGGLGEDSGKSVLQTDDNGYMLAGRHHSNQYSYRLWLIKTNSTGEEIWNKKYEELWNIVGIDECFQPTSDGGYIIVGYENYLDYPSYGVLLKVDGNGTKQWSTDLKSYATCTRFDAVQQMEDGSYMISGIYGLFLPYSNEDAKLIKFDSNGNYKWSKRFGDFINFQAGVSLEVLSNGDYLIGGRKYNTCHMDGWLIYEPNISTVAPYQPDPPEGPTTIKPDVVYEYNASTTDADGDDISYCFYWDDFEWDWTEQAPSGESVTAEHSWGVKGHYYITVLAVDETDLDSRWSESKSISVNCASGVPSGTDINMASGSQQSTKKIEDIRIGDQIKSWDKTNNELTTGQVTAIHIYTEDLPEDYLLINNCIVVSTNHFLFISDKNWTKANDTEVNDYMIKNLPDSANTSLEQITSIFELPSLYRVIYDLEIAPLPGENVNISGYWANDLLVGGFI